MDLIHKIDYYHIEILEPPGAAFQVRPGLKKAEANLLACCGCSLGSGKCRST